MIPKVPSSSAGRLLPADFYLTTSACRLLPADFCRPTSAGQLLQIVSAVMWYTYWSLLSYLPTLAYSHELWVLTEGTKSQIQAAKMSFLCRLVVVGASIFSVRRWKDVETVQVVTRSCVCVCVCVHYTEHE